MHLASMFVPKCFIESLKAVQDLQDAGGATCAPFQGNRSTPMFAPKCFKLAAQKLCDLAITCSHSSESAPEIAMCLWLCVCIAAGNRQCIGLICNCVGLSWELHQHCVLCSHSLPSCSHSLPSSPYSLPSSPHRLPSSPHGPSLLCV